VSQLHAQAGGPALKIITRNIVWLADTNYRIDLDNHIVRSCADTDQLDILLAADQVCPIDGCMVLPNLITSVCCTKLREAIDSRSVFAGYEEGPILFRPTYKYDVGTDLYDTGEKLRIPAWTGQCSVLTRINEVSCCP
jgi:synaptojanin